MNPTLARICVNACANCYTGPWQIESAEAHVTITELPDATLVCFRGSKSAEDWLNDGDVRKTRKATAFGIHEGFFNSYNSVDLTLHKTLRMDSKLIITGHSLGGAQALLCAAFLSHCGFKVDSCYTFGQPRVGNSDFSKWCAKMVPNHFRFVNRNDIVPRIPFWIMGYRHSGEPLVFEAEGKWKAWPQLTALFVSDLIGVWKGWASDKKLSLLEDHHIGRYQSAIAALQTDSPAPTASPIA